MRFAPRLTGAGCLIAALLSLASCGNEQKTADVAVDVSEVNSGGSGATVNDQSIDSFGRPAPGLSLTQKGLFENGNHLFRTPRGKERGTGPILNAQSCQGCHVLDGKGNPPRSLDMPLSPAGEPVSMLLKLGLSSDGSPDPLYGDQLQTRSAYGGNDNPDGFAVHNGSLAGGPALGEARVNIEYELIRGSYPDGTSYELLRPVYRLYAFAYGSVSDDLRLSPRVAPGVYGNGLLGAIDAEAIIAGADPDDENQDGISGRPHLIVDPVGGQAQLGRFGLKAGTASVLSQSVVAYRNDIGLTSRFMRSESCSPQQVACLAAAGQELAEYHEPDGVDLHDLDLAQVEFYVRTLAVPRRRGWDAEQNQWEESVGRGRHLFTEIGCASCHTPRWQTGLANGSVLGDASGLTELTHPAPSLAALSDKTIWPYTDLLLHDMGGSCRVSREHETDGQTCQPADPACRFVQRCSGLADGLPEQNASGSEWRTPPLWGVGLVQRVNPAAGFLHDGRARTLEEAILWHGQTDDSEAATTVSRFMNLQKADRENLLSFLRSM